MTRPAHPDASGSTEPVGLAHGLGTRGSPAEPRPRHTTRPPPWTEAESEILSRWPWPRLETRNHNPPCHRYRLNCYIRHRCYAQQLFTEPDGDPPEGMRIRTPEEGGPAEAPLGAPADPRESQGPKALGIIPHSGPPGDPHGWISPGGADLCPPPPTSVYLLPSPLWRGSKDEGLRVLALWPRTATAGGPGLPPACT